MEEILNEAESDPDKYILNESDNCSLQYKLVPHFHNLQELSDGYWSKIIRFDSVTVNRSVEITM